MPDYDPDPWNDAGTRSYDNCYDYATNNRTDHPEPKPPPNPRQDFGTPGRTKGVTPEQVEGVTSTGGRTALVHRFTCEGVKTGALLDGLKEPAEDGSCEADCWKVAYFIRPLTASQNGDYHFARQDSDGSWSHKRGSDPVERLADPDASDGRPIPEKPNAVPGYQFCGYLCCCPNTEVAALPPRETREEGGTRIASYADSSGYASEIHLNMDTAAVAETILGFAAKLGNEWKKGVGAGTALYSVGLEGATSDSANPRNILLTDTSITVWDEGPRHLMDAEGSVATQFSKWLAQPGQALGDRLQPKTVELADALSKFAAALGPVDAATVLPTVRIGDVSALTILSHVFAAIKIGGTDAIPEGFTGPHRHSEVTDRGNLPNDCHWDLKTGTSTATTQTATDANCIYHHYRTTVKLVKVCDDLQTTIGECSRVTVTGPHCGDPNADPPVPIPQPKTEAKPISNGQIQDGRYKQVFEQPDGTRVTVISLDAMSVQVTVEYPDGTTFTFTEPAP